MIWETAEVLRSLPPSCGSSLVVGIDGFGGAGKSSLADGLSALLADSVVIHTDDFASWSNPLNWWPRLLEQVLCPLAQGNPAHFQRFDWVERRLAEWVTVDAPIILLEGVSATRREFRPYQGYKIWVDTPRDLCLKRGIERDGDDALPQWLEWMAHEDAYYAEHQPREAADLVIPGY